MTLWALSILFLNPQGHSSETASVPFWRAKEKIYQRVVEDQEIMVSVSSSPHKESSLNHLKVVGGGRIATPVDFAFNRALDFKVLATAHEYVKEVTFDPSKKELSLRLEAYGHKMNLEMLVEPKNEPPAQRSIEFLVQSGPLKGLKGLLDFKAAEPLGKKPQSEVGLTAQFAYQKLPIPGLFVRFGLEVIFKRMAFRLRQKFEQEFRSGLKQQESTNERE